MREKWIEWRVILPNGKDMGICWAENQKSYAETTAKRERGELIRVTCRAEIKSAAPLQIEDDNPSGFPSAEEIWPESFKTK